MPSLSQKFFALFYPVKIRSGSSAINPVLELYYFRGSYQLATADALYSDGGRYRPLVAAFRVLRKIFGRIDTVLVLGTGMGSAASVAARMGFFPRFTFVDLDQTILDWAQEFLLRHIIDGATFVRADALEFIVRDTGCYDLIVVDVFIGRSVPPGIMSKDFLMACKSRLANGGRLILNFMVTAAEGYSPAKEVLEAVFGRVDEIAFGLNRVYISGAIAAT